MVPLTFLPRLWLTTFYAWASFLFAATFSVWLVYLCNKKHYKTSKGSTNARPVPANATNSLFSSPIVDSNKSAISNAMPGENNPQTKKEDDPKKAPGENKLVAGKSPARGPVARGNIRKKNTPTSGNKEEQLKKDLRKKDSVTNDKKIGASTKKDKKEKDGAAGKKAGGKQEQFKKEENKKEDNNDIKTNQDESPPVVNEAKVEKLGNLDTVIKDKRNKFIAEIDNMPSQHDYDNKMPVQTPPDKRIVINEKKCKLYETNLEETREDDQPDDLI